MITFPYAVKTTDDNLITRFSLDGAGVLMSIAPTLQGSVITNEGRAFRLAEFEYAHTDPVFNGYWKNGEDYFSPRLNVVKDGWYISPEHIVRFDNPRDYEVFKNAWQDYQNRLGHIRFAYYYGMEVILFSDWNKVALDEDGWRRMEAPLLLDTDAWEFTTTPVQEGWFNGNHLRFAVHIESGATFLRCSDIAFCIDTHPIRLFGSFMDDYDEKAFAPIISYTGYRQILKQNQRIPVAVVNPSILWRDIA